MSDILFAEALDLLTAGQRAEALARCHLILRAEPDHADSLHVLGLSSVQDGDPARGTPLIRRAIALNSGVAAYHNSLGLALSRLGRDDEAIQELLTAAELRPDSAEIQNNLATLLLQRGRHREAIAHYALALHAAPGIAEIWFNLANAHVLAECTADAETCFQKALALDPDHAGAQANYGRLLLARGRWAEAVLQLQRALSAKPQQPGAWTHLGIALHEQGQADQAEACYRQALALDPSFAEALYNLGCLSSGRGCTDEALAWHRAAAAANPAFGAARLAACMAHLPILYRSEEEVGERRRDYAEALTALCSSDSSSIAAAIGDVQPFFLPYQGEDDRALQAQYGQLACRVLEKAFPAPPLAEWRGGRIRLGIVSGFFCDHTLFKLFLEGWLSRLDRDRFEITGFHTGRTVDTRTEWCRSRCDRFVHGLSSKQAWRDAVCATAPHVLLYPEVGMDPVAGFLAALRLAPLQCVTWGHPETTGLPTIDCFLTSELMEPQGTEISYTERLIRLPDLGLCYDPEPLSPPRLDRLALGLDPDVPVFWSGQALYKYLPRYDAIYPRIAARLGACQFVFLAFAKSRAVTKAFRDRVHAAFAATGLDPARHVVVLPPLSQAEFVDAVRLADVVLDTPGWSGGKSTLDCLAVDPAIVTMPGRFMRGRHTSAILRHIGCEETIAHSLDEYVDLAAELASNEARRAAVRHKVSQRKHLAFADPDYIQTLQGVLTNALEGRWPE